MRIACVHAVPAAQPAPAGERIELLDVLRGFAIFGIVLFNYGPAPALLRLPWSAAVSFTRRKGRLVTTCPTTCRRRTRPPAYRFG